MTTSIRRGPPSRGSSTGRIVGDHGQIRPTDCVCCNSTHMVRIRVIDEDDSVSNNPVVGQGDLYRSRGNSRPTRWLTNNYIIVAAGTG